MAKLKLENGEELTDLEQISTHLAELDVALQSWPVAEAVSELLAKEVLTEDEKAAVLEAHSQYFKQMQEQFDYQTQDLVVLHAQVPGLDDILAKFDRCHTHSDDEVRYIVDGEGVFGFVNKEGRQILLTIEAGEYINVPKNTEHWFCLTSLRRIKAVRYFTSQEGWVANYTDTEVRIK